MNKQGSPTNNFPVHVAVFGSTGSIGRGTLDVADASMGRIRVVALSTHTQVELALEQARRFEPRRLIVSDPESAELLDRSKLPEATELLAGPESLETAAASEEVDVVVSAIVGSAGLRGTWAALEAGKTVALANKETLVMAGGLVTRLAADRGARLLPIDSEHSAIFQAIQAGRRQDVRRIVLTASGGPFRQHSARRLAAVTVEEALAHPTWNMGPKITVDSATMMNKALEIIEARWLFDMPPEKIDVVVHPQSIVHSMVEFVDGSVVAQLGCPDMRVPIQYALTYPERHPCPAPRLDWTSPMQLDFEPPDVDRFPAIALGHEVARSGGSSGAVLNAANEAAVGRFLEGQLGFADIVPACRAVLEQHDFEPDASLDDLIRLDRWARKEIMRWVCA